MKMHNNSKKKKEEEEGEPQRECSSSARLYPDNFVETLHVWWQVASQEDY